MVTRTLIGIFIALGLGAFARSAHAEKVPPGEQERLLGSCYLIEASGSIGEFATPSRTRYETWCYRKLDTPAGATFIFLVDGGEVRPETSEIAESDGAIIHASLLGGELTLHRVRGFNPLPVPLAPPPTTMQARIESLAMVARKSMETLRFLLSAPPREENVSLGLQAEAEITRYARLPFRGYWWPYKSQALAGSSTSPLAKYDTFVTARTGQSPQAAAWERANHRYKGIEWEGHCNGWSASSILRPEPRAPKRDPITGVTFSVADQKGLLAEKDDCVSYAFFGKRNTGAPGDNPRDIAPDEFHRVITYYIGNLGKPVIMDRFPGVAIDNNVISSFSTKVAPAGPATFTVTTVLTVHGYDKKLTSATGPAPFYNKTYKYTLNEGPGGTIAGGKWISSNPDFLWVPLAPASCAPTNPGVTEEWVSRIMAL